MHQTLCNKGVIELPRKNIPFLGARVGARLYAEQVHLFQTKMPHIKIGEVELKKVK